MRSQDVETIIAFEIIIYSHPWTEGIFNDCMKFGYLCLVAEIDHQIVAYGVLSVAAGESHILNLSVPKQHQRLGYGTQLLQQFLKQAQELNAESTLLEVRASNKSAIKLYENHGFNEIGVRKNYYPGTHGKEDAILYAIEHFN